MYRFKALLFTATTPQGSTKPRPETLKQVALVVIVLSLLVLCVLSFYADSTWFMKSSESLESSQISLQIDMFTSKNNIISQIFDYNQAQSSKWTEIIQCYNCDNTLQLKGANQQHVHEHNQGKMIKYDTKIRYNIATTGAISSTFNYNQTKRTNKDKDNQTILTRICMSLWSSNNTNSSINTTVTNHSSNSNNSRIQNCNMNDIINNDDNANKLQVDDLIDSEYKEIIQETDTNETQFTSNAKLMYLRR